MNYADLNERAVLALKQRLTTNLNAIIDQINVTTVGDGNRNQTQIAYPAVVLDAPPVPGQLINFPIYAIADGEMAFTDDVGWGATGEYDLYALVYESDPDPETLAWKLRRGLQALVTCSTASRNMEEGPYLGAWGLVIKRIIPARRLAKMDASGTTHLMSYAAVCMTLKDEQNYG